MATASIKKNNITLAPSLPLFKNSSIRCKIYLKKLFKLGRSSENNLFQKERLKKENQWQRLTTIGL